MAKPSRVGATLILLGTAMACAQVLGLEEATIVEQTGGQGGGGASSDSGAGGAEAGGDAGGGTGGDGGPAGEGGMSSQAGAGGAAGAGGGGAAPRCEFAFGDECVNQCATDQCCDTVSTCFGDEDCAAAFRCYYDCPTDDEECGTECLSTHPDGIGPLFKMLTCLSECGCQEEPAGDCTEVNPSESRVRACTLAVGCDPLVPVSTLSYCLTYGDYPYLRCAQGASSCGELARCLGRRFGGACEEGQMGWSCVDDTTAVRCTDSGSYTVDCGRFGGKCRPIESPDVDENAWPCALPRPLSCDDPPGEYHCNGTRLYHCADGVPYGLDCATLNDQGCQETPDFAFCTDRTSACAGQPNGFTCDRDVVRLCDTNGRLGVYDCAPAGATCALQGTQEAFCVAPGCEPADVGKCEERCLDETTMQVCIAGVAYPIDCAEHGFTGCFEYAAHPTTQAQYVRCE